MVDGGFANGTVTEIQKCAGREAGRMKWISEKDQGIYNAINKGTNLAYVPEIPVSMFYGRTGSNGLDAYMVSFREACRALKENGVRHPNWISLKRTCRVLRQF